MADQHKPAKTITIVVDPDQLARVQALAKDHGVPFVVSEDKAKKGD